MLDPINSSKQTCVPTSSNCVKWQGPYFDNFSLCSDASITEVIIQLVEKMNSIITTLNISEYEFSCLDNSKCGPQEFNDLVQLIIDKLCALSKSNGVDLTTLVMDIEPDCFKELNDNDTEINITTYANLIATKVCEILTTLDTINSSLTSINTELETIEDDVNTLKNTKQDILSITGCSGETDVQEVLQDTVTSLCEYKEVLGTTTELAEDNKCDIDYYPSYLSTGTGDMKKDISKNITVADNIKNLWTVICDLRREVYLLKSKGSVSILQQFSGYLTCSGKIKYKYYISYDEALIESCTYKIAPLSISGSEANIYKTDETGEYQSITTYASQLSNISGAAFNIISSYKLYNDSTIYTDKIQVAISKAVYGLNIDKVSENTYKISFNKSQSDMEMKLNEEFSGIVTTKQTYLSGTSGTQVYYLDTTDYESGDHVFYINVPSDSEVDKCETVILTIE